MAKETTNTGIPKAGPEYGTTPLYGFVEQLTCRFNRNGTANFSFFTLAENALAIGAGLVAGTLIKRRMSA